MVSDRRSALEVVKAKLVLGMVDSLSYGILNATEKRGIAFGPAEDAQLG